MVMTYLLWFENNYMVIHLYLTNIKSDEIAPTLNILLSSLATENHQRTDVYFPAHAW
jgi:hypothetical protein